MIVFIALVLVSGIAASVLIQVGNQLEMQALHSGQETIGEVATGVRVCGICGQHSTRNAGGTSYTRLHNMTIAIAPQAGSKGVDLDEAVLVVSNGNVEVVLKWDDADPYYSNIVSANGVFSTTTSVPTSGWWDGAWGYRKLITIDHDFVLNDLANFPVLISLSSDSDVASNAQKDGDDICFVSYADNSTKLSHEIEYYNGSTGQLNAWIKVPSVSSSENTSLWLYYGNPSCGNQESKTSVWSSNYNGVWHLNQSSGTLSDSTSYANDGTANGDPTYNVTGTIAGAMFFDGNGDWVRRNSRASLNFGTGDFTLECWVKTQETNTRGIISKYRDNQVPSTGYDLGIQNNKLRARFGDDDGGGQDLGDGSKTINDDVWHHLVVVFDRDANGIYYVDGAVDKQTDISSESGSTSNGRVLAFARFDTGQFPGQYIYFNGTIDEVRLSNVVRSSAWVNTTYQMINNNGGFKTLGDQENCTYPNIFEVDADEFGIIVIEDADGSCTYSAPVINRGDRVLLTVNLTACFSGGLPERTDVFGMVVPEEGTPGVFAFRTPSSYYAAAPVHELV